ncbi:ABC transporter ATP-binding protein [Falsiroseomonas oryzae]|uniref:ABC transporter ATP-binding protein n=1 Tax=Falsiroseomonas oryzae TaxID=2766473 RepID=UPI0022EAB259|nr:ABC transporter ATP-binding protein [Roseomonas sp. MO-31]
MTDAAALAPAATARAAPPRVPVLDVAGLSVQFRTRSGTVHALDEVSLQVHRGECLGVVGESGSGKSVTAYAVMRLLDPAARITAGRITFGGMDILAASEREMADLRGRELSMIFQNPRAALNPIRQVGMQIADVLVRHGGVTRAEAPARAAALLAEVGIPDPVRRAKAYPFELSGGMCQRVGIALALACRPALLIADEPTTGLDVTTQAVIMDLVLGLARARGMATVLITHDLGLASEYCDRTAVMHAGHVVEAAPAADLFAAPRHPYTAKLIAATPQPGRALSDLAAIPGGLPDLRRGDLPACRFLDRCERAEPGCAVPPLPRHLSEDGRMVACRHPL